MHSIILAKLRRNAVAAVHAAFDRYELDHHARQVAEAAAAAMPDLGPLPADYIRPALEEFLAKGYASDLPPDDQQAHYEAFFERYEAGLRELEHAGKTEAAPTLELELVDAETLPPAVEELGELAELEPPWEYERDERGVITGGGPPAADATPVELPAESAT